MGLEVTGLGVRRPLPGVVYPPTEATARHVATGALPVQSLAAALVQSMQRHCSRIALLGPGWSMTHGELDEMTDRAALAFHRLGLEPLDRVIFQVQNSRNLVVATIGCLKAGLIPVCTLHAHREVEIRGLGGHSEARAHFIETAHPGFDFLDFTRRMRREMPHIVASVLVDGSSVPDCPSMQELIDAVDPIEARDFVGRTVAEIDPFQVALFQISGGSTGLPKIIPRLQADYLANMQAMIAASEITAADCILSPGPFLHNAGFVCFWGPALLAGGRLAIPRGLDQVALDALFLECAPTWVYLPKPLLPRIGPILATHPEARARLRGFVCASAGAEIEAETGVPTLQFYGMTEGIICQSRPSDPPALRHGSIGWQIAAGDELRILAPGTEDEVREGHSGELVFRGPYAMCGYYNAPNQNAESFTSDGWVRSGDLVRIVRIDGTPALVFEGRLKDLISRGGEKISCEEVERHLRSHPAVADVAIIPVPDPFYGERGCAFIVTREGVDCPDIIDLGRHLGVQGLAKFKWPEMVRHIDAFPTTKAGKLDKHALRRIAREEA